MNNENRSYERLLGNNSGMALISTLLILGAVSLIAVGMSGDTSTVLKIAGNRKQLKQEPKLPHFRGLPSIFLSRASCIASWWGAWRNL